MSFILALSPTALLVTRAVTVGGEGASGRAKEKDRFCGQGIMSFFRLELCLAGVMTVFVCEALYVGLFKGMTNLHQHLH